MIPFIVLMAVGAVAFLVLVGRAARRSSARYAAADAAWNERADAIRQAELDEAETAVGGAA